MRRGVPVIPCRRCGVDTRDGVCRRCAAGERRARRHAGYDDPVYRRVRAAKAGRPCERLGCSRRGGVLHHVDGNPAHNVTSNYAWLCTPCSREADAAMRLKRDGPKRKASPWR